MIKFFNTLFLGLAIMFLSSPLLAQEVTIEASVTAQEDYRGWKTDRIAMQLQREHNTIFSSSLLQPAAVMGSAFFSAMAIVYTIAMFSGHSDRHDAKNFAKSIELLINLIKAPFTLQYEKNKAHDRIARMNDALALRGLTT